MGSQLESWDVKHGSKSGLEVGRQKSRSRSFQMEWRSRRVHVAQHGSVRTMRFYGRQKIDQQVALHLLDIAATNGVVHIVDTVLIPPAWPTKNIVQLALGTKTLSTLVTALKAGNLVTALQGKGPFTVFAPANAAFAKLPKATLASLLEPKNKNKLVDILTYHVVAGAAAYSKDLKPTQNVKTLQGDDVLVTSSST